MPDVTPDDFDQHLNRHTQSMEAMAREIQAALSTGVASQVTAVLHKYQSTMKVQERLNTLSSRLNDSVVIQPPSVAIVERAEAPRKGTPVPKGMCLGRKDFVFPFWEAISKWSGPFTIDDLRIHIRENYHLRPLDLSLTAEGQPRWLRNSRMAFKDFVYSNHADWKAGKASTRVVYMENLSRNGNEGRYVLNDFGRTEMKRVLTERNIPVPAV